MENIVLSDAELAMLAGGTDDEPLLKTPGGELVPAISPCDIPPPGTSYRQTGVAIATIEHR